MNRKKIIVLIVLSLLLAAGIIFIVLNPAGDTTPTEHTAPTEEIVETAVPTETEAASETQPTDAPVTEAATQPEEMEPAATQAPETKPSETEPEEVKPTEPTEPKPTGPDDYDNTGSNIGASTEPVLTGDTEYEKYMNMSAEDQEAYFNSFSSPAEFFDWYNKAKQEYEDSRDVIEVGPDATIDLGDIGN